ncbi:uncharacterized protein LOC129763189 [Toxorhynchites rutilus septentrionalis]|uniref:uncharacterized protein LOC129763189 n=1 Tax=Toxorhynchites rutilus septentrionalis TaxID=329112 RepID=UPI00247894A5|nr:uncharacterized protein LOC129763189 [Toxorhynchites rutilus septentrionalis]
MLVESMVATGLLQINSLSNANGRLLDLAFVSDPSVVELIVPPSALLRIDSHHMPFVLRIDVNDNFLLPPGNTIETDDFDFRRCNFAELNRAVSTIDWASLFLGKDTDETTIHETLLQARLVVIRAAAPS